MICVRITYLPATFPSTRQLDNDDVLGDLLTEYIMLSPWRHFQNSCHYNIQEMSFVTAWETSRWHVADGDISHLSTNAFFLLFYVMWLVVYFFPCIVKYGDLLVKFCKGI
jgi:hypothetical protein